RRPCRFGTRDRHDPGNARHPVLRGALYVTGSARTCGADEGLSPGHAANAQRAQVSALDQAGGELLRSARPAESAAGFFAKEIEDFATEKRIGEGSSPIRTVNKHL